MAYLKRSRCILPTVLRYIHGRLHQMLTRQHRQPIVI